MDKQIKHSEAFLNQKIGGVTSFNVPKDYFNSLENDIFLKISEDKLPKTNVFTTPSAYFDGLEEKLLAKVAPVNQKGKLISFKERVVKVIPFAAAASILLFIGLNTFTINGGNNELSLENLNSTDIEYWMNNTEILESDVAILLNNELLEEQEFSFAELQTESIEEYIITTDNTSLLNEIP